MPHLTGGQFPGLFLFATPSRMMRPVLNLATNTHELIGSFEQVSGRYTSLLALCIVWSVCLVGVGVDWFP